MPKLPPNPKLTVISVRISDEEHTQLTSLMQTCNKSMSDIMREALELFFSSRQDAL